MKRPALHELPACPAHSITQQVGAVGAMPDLLLIDVNQMLEYLDNPPGPSDAAAGPSMAPAQLPYEAVPASALTSICWGALLSGNGCAGPGYTGRQRHHFKNRFCARCQAQGVRVAAARVRLLAPGAAPDAFRKADALSNRNAQGAWIATGFSSPEWFRVLNHTKGCTGPACVLFSESIKSPPGHGALSDERLRANGLFPVSSHEPTVLFSISRGTLVPNLPVALLGRPEPPLWTRRGGEAPAASDSASAVQSLGDSAHLGVLDPAALASVHAGVARLQAAASALTASRGTGHSEPSSLKRKRTWLQVRTSGSSSYKRTVLKVMWSEAGEARLGGLRRHRLDQGPLGRSSGAIVLINVCPGSNPLTLIVTRFTLLHPPPHALQNQATAFLGQLAAVCNQLVAYDVEEGDYKPDASAPGSGEWVSDGCSTVSDSTEPDNGGGRADAGAQAGAYPNPPLAPRVTAPHAEFGGYPNQSLAKALQSEFGATAALRYLSSQHPHAEACRMASFQDLEQAAPLGGVLEPQFHTASFGALAAAAPQGGVPTAQSQTATFAPLGEVYAARPPRPPRAERAIAGSQHMSSPSGIAQTSNPAGTAQTSAPSGIVAAPSGLVSSDSGIAPPSGGPPLTELTGGGALGNFFHQLATATDAGSRASLIATLNPSGAIVAAPSGLVSSDSGIAPPSSGPPLPELTGGGALGTFFNQLATATDAGSRASLIATLNPSGAIVAAPSGLVPSDGVAPPSGAPLPELTGGGALGLFFNQLATATDAGSRASLIATLNPSGARVERHSSPRRAPL